MLEKNIQPLHHVAIVADSRKTSQGNTTKNLIHALKKSHEHLHALAEYLFSATGVSCVSFHDLFVEKIIREGLTENAAGNLSCILSSLEPIAGAKLLFTGYTTGLPKALRGIISTERPKENSDLENTVIWLINYSGKREIVNATRKMADATDTRNLSAEAFERQLLTVGFPDPDLLIVTGGDPFLPDFLIYKIAYIEMYFSQKSWGEFGVNDLKAALQSYRGRERRYGNI